MFTVYETSARPRRNSEASVLTSYSITSSPLSSHRSSVTSLSDLTANELAFQECIEVIDVNVEEVITNKADAREKKWWIDGNYKIIDENRLPLILVEGVSYKEFEKKSEIANASKYWEFQDGIVVIIELPNRDHEIAHYAFTKQFMRQDPQDTVDYVGSTTCHATPGRITRGSSKQPDSSFVPRLLPKPAQNPCDVQGNPWPTIIIEVANSESLSRIMHKTTQFWLAPNRVEDVIVLKLWKWNSRRDQNGTPLRRLTCYKFCRRRSPLNVHGNFQPVQTIEFGNIDRNNQQYNGCTTAGMSSLNITPRCIFRGCPQVSPYPIPNHVIIDFFPIQQSIFRAM
ncbi:13200_t:CDS:2 [Funneliformis geosporum]|uniref:269_t:CDS:1 n=1 Tax=Funneliformis geosporum TaxID=1117311 RepID=A0A9W4SZV5_9GLOM|nr:269_t:CDS:2 [Funneliformis geosporum]CAI2191588.1 13200_t:CDS:2 [Funneliformis geosporum]